MGISVREFLEWVETEDPPKMWAATFRGLMSQPE